MYLTSELSGAALAASGGGPKGWNVLQRFVREGLNNDQFFCESAKNEKRRSLGSDLLPILIIFCPTSAVSAEIGRTHPRQACISRQ
jgi:hypothetical protein